MVRTRFAPSPTGFLHIGSLRTALYAYVMAKHDNSQFILRVEDTDQKREIGGATDALKNTLKIFGLNWDEYYLQSERLDIYLKAAKKLVTDGNAFYCQCPPRNAKTDGFSQILRDPCRNKNLDSGAIKLKVPDNETVSYFDFVHKKEISWETNGVYDATLLKSDGFPTYHLAAMVDDIEMKITHILRGHDWMPSTPIHLLVFKYLGGDRPEIGHLSDILNAKTGKKLSKRRDSVMAEDFLKAGYLPEALLNFVMLLGWAPKDNRELYSLEEFVKEFDINGFQEANPRFEDTKLKWFNGHYLRQKSDDELIELIDYPDKDKLRQILPLIKDRLAVLSDFDQLTSFFFKSPEITARLNKNHLTFAIDNYDKMIKGELIEEIKTKGWKVGDFFMTIRIAICGTRSTPPITETMLVLGRDESIKRLIACQAKS
ncbi:glutamate--tRNA ligase [Candidatus Amesbacteria bacterium]|nr:glutamate--tRNA ligase [Candidatus Amesbacteria bacterium]